MSLDEGERDELRRVADGVPPSDMEDETLRLRLKDKGLVQREPCSPWRWRVTEAGRTLLGAPTR